MPDTVFVPFADCCEAAIMFDLDTIPSVITLGFHNTGSIPFDVPALADLATVLSVNFVTPLAVQLNTTVHFRNIHLRDLDSVSGAVFDQPLTQVGSSAGVAVPNQVATTVTFLTGVAGRSYRGRNYVPGATNGALADQKTFTDGYLADILSVYEGMDTHLASAAAEHVVLSRFLDKAPRESGHAQAVIGYRVNAPIHTQRRRLT